MTTEQDKNVNSCSEGMTRQEFITKIIKGAALTAGVIASPAIVDSFIAPASAAGLSSCNTTDTSSNGQMLDTATIAGGIGGGGDVNTEPGSDTFCSRGDVVS